MQNSSHTHGTQRGGSTFIGILIGLVLGLAIALGVAWYINKLPNPFNVKPQAPLPPKPAVTAKAAPDTKAPATIPITPEAPSADKAATDAKALPVPKEAFFVQAGSFQNAPDADNLKARLALMGIEATVQTRTIPEKGVWHRVRVGPYTDIEELNRVRATLKQNNIETALVKVREAEQ